MTNSNFLTIKNNIIRIIDYCFLILVFSFLINDIFLIFNNILNYCNNFFNFENIVCNMIDVNCDSYKTNSNICFNNETGISAVINIFIYSAGALRLHLIRSTGTPFQRGFIISSTFAADAITTGVKNAIIKPEYVEKHINILNKIIKGNNSSPVDLHVDNDTEILVNEKEFSIINKFIPEDLEGLRENIINTLINLFKSILEPVYVDYSNEMLANQIYLISIMLFILSIIIIILIIGFIINLLVWAYSDKLINLFKNKFIRWYIGFNKKMIGIELFFLSISILYFMCMLSYGIHFIATHPIIFS